MSGADAFLSAIFANPADDIPRLVYADWLEERGQASYARFIRLQCEAARHELWTAESNRLWEEIGRAWPGMPVWPCTRESAGLGAELDRLPTYPDAIHFRRGFLSPKRGVGFKRLVLDWSRWWPWFPTPDSTLLAEAGWEAFAAECPTLARIRHLRVQQWAYAQDIGAFLASPHLANLESLDLSDNALDSVFWPVLNELLRPGVLQRVRELRVRVYHPAGFSGLTNDAIPCTAVPPESPRGRLEAKFGRVIVSIG
jgi:uncharacterized protein (TIGR02996 family)